MSMKSFPLKNHKCFMSVYFFPQHHMIERIRKGQDIQTAVMISLFQASFRNLFPHAGKFELMCSRFQSTYTTIFGMYSAFLFVRTGHIAAPVVAHGFCNFMGFPDFNELLNHPPRTRDGEIY